jgi:hypothetical protein
MRRDQVLTGEQPPQQQSALQQFLQQAKEAGGQVVEKMREISNSHHAAPLHAWFRQGADEIAQVLPAFPDSVKAVPETGQLFEPTSQEVFLNKTGRELEIDLGR